MTSAHGAEPTDTLREVEQKLETGKARTEQLAAEARKLTAELERLRSEAIEAAATLQRQEELATRLEGELLALQAEREHKTGLLAARRGELAASITALTRLGGQPAEVMIASPGSAVDAVRSSMLLSAMVPTLAERIERISADVARLAAIEADIGARRAAHQDAVAFLRKQRIDLAALQDRTRSLRREAERDRRREQERLSRLAAEAKSIRALIEQLEQERLARERREQDEAESRARARARAEAEDRIRRASLDAIARAAPAMPAAPAAPALRAPPAPPPMAAPPPPQEQSARVTRPITPAPPAETAPARKPRVALLPLAPRTFAEARGSLPLPVRGRIVGRFGQTTERGTKAKGITVLARPLAQVIAPHDGRVAFAGPYRGYGQLLIIEHGDGYHTLLAGLSRIDGSVGQWLLAGEPVGQMGPESDGKPKLYVEIRRNGQPINPLPWLAAEERRVSG
jgi:septal ring factor EnvC (AmiA/AmiB activator)